MEDDSIVHKDDITGVENQAPIDISFDDEWTKMSIFPSFTSVPLILQQD